MQEKARRRKSEIKEKLSVSSCSPAWPRHGELTDQRAKLGMPHGWCSNHSALSSLVPARPLLWSPVLPTSKSSPGPPGIDTALWFVTFAPQLSPAGSALDHWTHPSQEVLCTLYCLLEPKAELAGSRGGKCCLAQFLQRQNLFRPRGIEERW